MDREGVGRVEGRGKLRKVIQGRGGVAVRPGKSRRAWSHSFISSLCAGFLSWEYIRYGCFAFILGNFFICWATRAVFIGAGDVVNSTKGGEKVIGDPERDERQYEGWDRSR